MIRDKGNKISLNNRISYLMNVHSRKIYIHCIYYLHTV
jgi:hypothetical protein